MERSRDRDQESGKERERRTLRAYLGVIGMIAALVFACGGVTAASVAVSAQEAEPPSAQEPEPLPEEPPPQPQPEPTEEGAPLITPAPVDAFAERPIIEGLWEFTAYTLRQGELRVGNLSLPFEPSQLRWLYLDVGLTGTLQLGTAIPANALGVLNLIGKLRLLHSEEGDGFSLALPFRLDLTYRPVRNFLLGTGLVISWPLEELTLHGGMWLLLSRGERVRISTMYAILDTTVLSDTKLLLEVDLYPGGTDMLWIRLGTLRRVGVVHIRTAASVLFPGGDNLVQVDLFFRF